MKEFGQSQITIKSVNVVKYTIERTEGRREREGRCEHLKGFTLTRSSNLADYLAKAGEATSIKVLGAG